MHIQIEREGLACIYGIKKFHSYIFGRSFTLITDNLPLKSLFSEKQPIPQHASGRIQRWSLTLASYQYKIEFCPTYKNRNADAFSRLPHPVVANEETVPTELVLLMEAMNDLPITCENIKDWTRKDPVLSKVYRYVQHRWPENVPVELKAFSTCKSKLSSLGGCLLHRSRVVIPPPGRRKILVELHQGHPGVSRMKSLSRMYTWWPKMDEELIVKRCSKCQENQNKVPVVPLQLWKFPATPWSRLHIDYAGPFLNSMFLVIIDAYSKWVEIFRTSSSTSTITIQCLRSTFARYGIPHTIVSINGTCFTSKELEIFLKANGITHLSTSPYHPQSNGLAEKMVQSFKCGMKKMSGDSIDVNLARFLFSYRVTPHSTTGVSPSELMFGREIQTLFHLLQPDLFTKVSKKQEEQTKSFNRRAKDRQFYQGDYVYVRNFSHRNSVPWIAGVIVKRIGNVSYMVRLENTDNVVKRDMVINVHQIHRMRQLQIQRKSEMEVNVVTLLDCIDLPQRFKDEFYN